MSIQPSHHHAEQLRENYLNGIASTLGRSALPFEVQDSVRELRTHLDAGALAYEEMGLSPEEAMRASIQKFGDQRRIGKMLGREILASTASRNRVALGIGLGAVANASLFMFADSAMVATGTVGSPSPGMAILGLLYGIWMGWRIGKKNLSPWAAARKNAISAPTFILILVCGLNFQSVLFGFDPRLLGFLGMVAAGFSILGAVSGLTVAGLTLAIDGMVRKKPASG
jgi:hypothetical protein